MDHPRDPDPGKISFACPSCGAPGAVDAAFAGRQARCKHCKHSFTIPTPGRADADVYSLSEAPEKALGSASPGPEPGSVYVPSRGDDATTTTPSPRQPRRAATGTRRESNPARGTWLIRGAIVAALGLAAVGLLAPGGTGIVGSALLVLGSILVLVGYGAGAFGAFSEDFVYGMLYLLIPLYAAYYLLTRWDDLWPWFACSTAGVALVLIGTELLRWSGAIA